MEEALNVVLMRIEFDIRVDYYVCALSFHLISNSKKLTEDHIRNSIPTVDSKTAEKNQAGSFEVKIRLKFKKNTSVCMFWQFCSTGL